jgi:hypothetical protein
MTHDNPTSAGGPAPVPVMPLEYYTPPANPRPTAVTTIAILGICWGGLGLLCYGWGLVSSAVFAVLSMFTITAGGANNVFYVMQTPGTLTINLGGGLVNTALAVLLLSASIAALSLRRWAPRGLRQYAVATLVVQFILTLLSVFWVLPEMNRHMQAQFAAMPGPAFAGTFYWMQVGTVIFTWLLMSALPVAILVILKRPHVKAAFEERPGEAVSHHISS